MRACPPRTPMRKHQLSGALVLLAVVLNAIHPLRAASFTWKLAPTGQATRWSNAGNWTPSGGAPGASDTAVFSSAGSATVQVQNNTMVTGIAFDNSAQAYSFNGNGTLTIASGGIVNSSANLQTFTRDLSLAANQTWNVGSAGVTVSATIGGSGSLTKLGSG